MYYNIIGAWCSVGLPITSRLPSFSPLQSFPNSAVNQPVTYYPSVTTYYPDPYDYPIPYLIPNSANNEEQQN